LFFFFSSRRRHTRLTCDWSSDVCSSDLPGAALLEVRLETGRTHQIRVHLAAIGHPVAGDTRYGRGGRFGLERQFLHSARLAFQHPFTDADLDLRSELPPDLAQALAA